MDIRSFEDTDEHAVIQLWNRCGLLRAWNDPHKDIARKQRVQREPFVVDPLSNPSESLSDVRQALRVAI